MPLVMFTIFCNFCTFSRKENTVGVVGRNNFLLFVLNLVLSVAVELVSSCEILTSVIIGQRKCYFGRCHTQFYDEIMLLFDKKISAECLQI